jgi:iron complex outermembrane receptor protein
MASSHNHDLRLTTLAAMLALPVVMGGYHTPAGAVELEEVIVTAQKRTESVMDIPSTVNVINGDSLKDFNVFSFNDLGALSAGLEITSFNGRSGRINLRGIDYNPNSASEASVTAYWNQAIVDSNAVFQQMFDIQRIEVLRGPQGTLAGRTSPAGAINIHTVRPNLDEIDGEVRATVADNDGLNTQAAVSVPLIPGELGLRIAGVYDDSDLDEIENDLTGKVTDDESTAGRISLSWLPTDAVSVDLAVQYLEREFDDVVALEGAPTGSEVIDPGGELREIDAFDRRGAALGFNNGVEDYTDAEYWNSSLVLEWDLESHTITSVTGYHDTDSSREYNQWTVTTDPDNVRPTVAIDDRTDWSQELRIASNGNETWDYMLGAYYEDSDIEFNQENYLPPASQFFPGSAILLFPAEGDRWGLFTHNEFYLTDTWTLQAGLRYQEYEVDRDLSAFAGDDGFTLFPPGGLVAQILSEENQHYDDDSVTGQVTLQYALNDDLNLYALVGTSWRPGGVTVTQVLVPEDVLLFDSEDSTSYELGFKSNLMGGAVRLSGALYYQDFDDYIARLNALSIRGFDGDIETSGITVNGDAEVWGAETDLTAILGENWLLGGTLSYSKGEYKNGTELPCNEFDDDGAPVIPDDQNVALCDVGGDAIGNAPEFTASINSEYSIPFDRFEGYGRVLYTYTGDRASDVDDVDTFSIVNLYLGVREEQWNVELFATNLFDEEAVRGATEATPLVRQEPTGYGWRFLVAGRRIGLSASYRF